jgi:prevent-host-death family protein
MNVATSSGNVGVRELRDHLSKYLAEVKDGGEVVVTEHGRPIARLIPADAPRDRLAELIAAGRAQAPRGPRRALPQPMKAKGTVSDLVAEQRLR